MVYWFLHTLLIFYLVTPFDLAEIHMSAFRHMLLPSLSLYISGQLLDLHSPKFPSDKVSCSVVFYFASFAHFLDTNVLFSGNDT